MNPIQALPNTRQIYQDNLNTLSTRARGQKFIVDMNGRLKVVSSIYDRLRYFFFKGVEQYRVKKTISKSLSKIDLSLSDANDIETLFFKTLKPLSGRVYSRKKLSPKLITHLRGTEQSEAVDELARRVAEVRFAVKLGVDFLPVSEGNSGTYIGRDYQKKRLVVFKPFNEEGSSLKSPKLASKIKGLFFKIFPCMRSHLNVKRECAYLNEIGASTVDKFLDLNLVPETRLVTFKSEKFEEEDEKKGSCQLFVQNGKMLQNLIGLPSFHYTSFLKRPLQKLWLMLFGSQKTTAITDEDLIKLAIIEFLTGNQDGHTNNQLFNGIKLYAIDYGLAFPSAHPEGVFSTVNQYHFAYLPGAKKNFNKDHKALIQKLDEPDELFEQLSEDMTDEDVTGFDEDQKQFMEERIQILQAAIAQGKSIQYLGQIKYACDFERARQELGINEESSAL